ncbi:rod shape-determining protein RodA [Limisphaera sp. VF-2]|jgi:rod shape determining protein RodA|uniref:rod shape-determining protein RodA n=1 Tax=Limisphaera sp. VF-2 TaxID=3400418 RepID=UPI001759732D|nr:rod shape-determining protein RodA [Limisphaera sp.]
MSDLALQPRNPRLDWPLWLAVGGLMVLGLLFVASATAPAEEHNQLALWDRSWFRQAIWYGVGLAAAVALSSVDYSVLARWAPVAYWSLMGVLALVLVPGIGAVRYGARRWLDLGPFQVQPSEFAKLVLIVMLAHFLSRPADELRRPEVLWKALGWMALPFVLILKEPDLGSALLLVPPTLAMLLAAGVPRRYIQRLVAGCVLVGGLLVLNVLFAPPAWQIRLEEYQRQRLLVYFGRDFAPPDATPEERQRARALQEARSYQVRQALIAVGSGGWWGKGWGQGTQIALGFLPRTAAHNDFIFSVIAEEKGFIGSVTVLTLYGVVLLRGMHIARQARDRLGRLMAVGVVTLLFSQVFLNIGMNIRLMPVTGVPLPLLSYGGSSVVTSLIAAGLLQNVYLHRKGYGP